MSVKHKQTIRNYLKYYYYGSYNNERVTLAFSAIKAVNTNGAKNNTLNKTAVSKIESPPLKIQAG